MKTIGLLGGMSWESSIVYEQIINQEVRARLGGVHSASLLVRSYDFAHIERLQAAGDWDQAGQILAADAARLQDAGAQILVLATNTMHRVYDQIAAAVSIPFPHIADATGAAVSAAGLSRVGLLVRTDLGDHAWRFELRQGDSDHKSQHPHFVCIDCGNVNCLPDKAVSVRGAPGVPRALRRLGVVIQLQGRCDSCERLAAAG